MATDTATSPLHKRDGVSRSFMRGLQPTLEWVRLYEKGGSLPRIARRYQVSASTVRRYLVHRISLRDRASAAVVESTKYAKKPVSGDKCEGAFLAGLVEDFHVRKAGRLVELGTTTTHPAMMELFNSVFSAYGHPVFSPSYEKELVRSIKIKVRGHNALARIDYKTKHGAPHPDEALGNKRP